MFHLFWSSTESLFYSLHSSAPFLTMCTRNSDCQRIVLILLCLAVCVIYICRTLLSSFILVRVSRQSSMLLTLPSSHARYFLCPCLWYPHSLPFLLRSLSIVVSRHASALPAPAFIPPHDLTKTWSMHMHAQCQLAEHNLCEYVCICVRLPALLHSQLSGKCVQPSFGRGGATHATAWRILRAASVTELERSHDIRMPY